MSSSLGNNLSRKIANMGFLCACLVVLIHCPVSQTHSLYIEHFLKVYLTLIAVPCFFMISGFLLARHVLEDRWYTDAIKKRIRTLLVPLLVLDTMWFPIKYAIHYIGVSRFGADGSSEVMRLTLYNVLSGIGIIPWGQAVVIGMWYIKALFLLVLISPAFKFLVCQGKGRMIVSVFCVFGCSILQNALLEGGVWNYELNLQWAFYFMIGMAFCKHGGLNEVVRFRYISVVVAVVALFCLEKNIGQSIRGITLVCATLAMSIVVWSFVPSRQWSRHLVGNSFPVFVTHGMILYLLPIPFKVLGRWNDVVNVLGPIPIWFVVMGIALSFSVMVKRYFPRFSRMAFGGR